MNYKLTVLTSLLLSMASYAQTDPVKKHNGYRDPREIDWPVTNDGSNNPEIKVSPKEKVAVPVPVPVPATQAIQPTAPKAIPQATQPAAPKAIPQATQPAVAVAQLPTVRKAKGECDISTYMTRQPDGSWSGSQPNNIPEWVGKNIDVQIEYLPNGDIINCVRYTIPNPATGEMKKGPTGNPGELCGFMAYNPTNSRGVFMGMHKVTNDRNERMFRRIEASGVDKIFELCSDQPTDWEVFGDLNGKEAVVISGRKGSTVRGVGGLKVIMRTFDENSPVSCNEHFRKRVVAGEFTSSSDGCADGKFFKPEY